MQLVHAPVWVGVFLFSQIKGSILVALVFLSEATPVVNSLTNLRAIILLSKQYYSLGHLSLLFVCSGFAQSILNMLMVLI